jgi:hypothetical protein
MIRHDYFATGTFPWSGLRLAGRIFNSPELFSMMRRQCLSNNCVRNACLELDVLPYPDEVDGIERHIEAREAAYC